MATNFVTGKQIYGKMALTDWRQFLTRSIEETRESLAAWAFCSGEMARAEAECAREYLEFLQTELKDLEEELNEADILQS